MMIVHIDICIFYMTHGRSRKQKLETRNFVFSEFRSSPWKKPIITDSKNHNSVFRFKIQDEFYMRLV